MASYYIGVDVGTGSARAGIFDITGRMMGQASREIEMYRPQANFCRAVLRQYLAGGLPGGARCD